MALAESTSISTAYAAPSPNLNAFRAKNRAGRRNAVPTLFPAEGGGGKEGATATTISNTLRELEEKFNEMKPAPSNDVTSSQDEKSTMEVAVTEGRIKFRAEKQW